MESEAVFATIKGVIRRRILLNYVAEPGVVTRFLPEPFRPKLFEGMAVVGVCLIRLEEMRPSWMPVKMGLSSDNAAHRIAVEWTDEHGKVREGVFIPRRDTNSCLNQLAGGRLFPGEYHRAWFDVVDADGVIDFSMKSVDGEVAVEFRAGPADDLPDGSVFRSVDEASRFFEGGCDGFSGRSGSEVVDGMRLCVGDWSVKPLQVEYVRSNSFENRDYFPEGSLRLDHALLMRDVAHEWKPIMAPGRVGLLV